MDILYTEDVLSTEPSITTYMSILNDLVEMYINEVKLILFEDLLKQDHYPLRNIISDTSEESLTSQTSGQNNSFMSVCIIHSKCIT